MSSYYYQVEGKRVSMNKWIEYWKNKTPSCEVSKLTIYTRVRNGWPIEIAVQMPRYITLLKQSGWAGTKTYGAWQQARARCYHPQHISYSGYGGRGITMCDEWRNSFLTFLKDMGECPDEYFLDRIDVDGNYEPSNCRWVDIYENANNKRIYFQNKGEN